MKTCFLIDTQFNKPPKIRPISQYQQGCSKSNLTKRRCKNLDRTEATLNTSHQNPEHSPNNNHWWSVSKQFLELSFTDGMTLKQVLNYKIENLQKHNQFFTKKKTLLLTSSIYGWVSDQVRISSQQICMSCANN